MEPVPLRLVRSECYAADTAKAEKAMRRQLDAATARRPVQTRGLGGAYRLCPISEEAGSREGHHGTWTRTIGPVSLLCLSQHGTKGLDISAVPIIALVKDRMDPYGDGIATRLEILAMAERLLKAGERIRFFIVDDDGTRRRSHEVVMQGRHFVLTGMDGWQELGSFATLGAPSRAGFAASAESLEHGQE